MYQSSIFGRFARWTAQATGRPSAFGLALAGIVVWAALGPIFRFSDTWQLVVNTATTVITFLMVFVIQNSQNRDSQSLQIKIDELIRALEGPHNALLDLEELDEVDLIRIRRHYADLAKQARSNLLQGLADTGVIPLDLDDTDAAPKR